MSIKPASSIHHNEASQLIFQSGPAAFEHIFNQGHGPNVVEFLSRCFKSKHTMFSHKYHLIWEENGKAIGTLGIFSKSLHDNLLFQNAASIYKHYGFRGIVKGLQFERKLVKPPKKDSLYIGHIAVNSKHREKGIARKLILAAEQQAKSKDIRYLDLDVAENNLRALGLYELLGFKQIKLNQSYHANLDNHIYMRKTLRN